jgi:hypothetical protein
MLFDAGFKDVRIRTREETRERVPEGAAARGVQDFVASATIEAVRR